MAGLDGGGAVGDEEGLDLGHDRFVHRAEARLFLAGGRQQCSRRGEVTRHVRVVRGAGGHGDAAGERRCRREAAGLVAPLARFGAQSGHRPEQDVVDDRAGGRAVVGVAGGPDGGADVVPVGEDRGVGCRLVGGAQREVRGVGEVDESGEVPPFDDGPITAFVKAQCCELADGLEELEPPRDAAWSGDEQRTFDERSHVVFDVCRLPAGIAHGDGAGEIEVSGEHRQRLERRSFTWAEQLVGPLDGGQQAAVSLLGCSAATQQTEAVGQPVADLGDGEPDGARCGELRSRAAARRGGGRSRR
ncbi:MAG: hypothetical protein QM733_09445 [Ilumatobacteraceae bacterium]